jgi:serine phosphatase RsbU (regulator of sigma subunit)
VDAGHGHALVRRGDGGVEELRPRGLPLGVLPEAVYQEGSLVLRPGDAVVVYSDGLVEAPPDRVLDRSTLGGRLGGAASAAEIVERLVALGSGERPGPTAPPPDDLTVVVLRCRAGPEHA